MKNSTDELKYYPTVGSAASEAIQYAAFWWVVSGIAISLLFYILFTVINKSATWEESFRGFYLADIILVATFLLKMQSTYGKQYSIERKLKSLLPPSSKILKGKVYVTKKRPKTSGYQWDVSYEGVTYKFTLVGQWLGVGTGKMHFISKHPFDNARDLTRTKIYESMRSISSQVEANIG